MEMMCIGVKGVAGTAKATGNPFEMCSVRVLVPIERGKFGTVTITGAGFEEAEVQCDPRAVAALSAFDGKFPLRLTLITEQRFYRGKFETVCTGAQPLVAAVQAARS